MLLSIVRGGGMTVPNTGANHYYQQLGLSEKDSAIKEFIQDMLMLLNPQ